MEQVERLTETPLRRLVPRQVTLVGGQYMIQGVRPKRWRECLIVDMSVTGAGLELRDTTPEELQNRHIILAAKGKHHKAEVIYAREGLDHLRVGVRFAELTDAELAYIESLLKMGVRW